MVLVSTTPIKIENDLENQPLLSRIKLEVDGVSEFNDFVDCKDLVKVKLEIDDVEPKKELLSEEYDIPFKDEPNASNYYDQVCTIGKSLKLRQGINKLKKCHPRREYLKSSSSWNSRKLRLISRFKNVCIVCLFCDKVFLTAPHFMFHFFRYHYVKKLTKLKHFPIDPSKQIIPKTENHTYNCHICSKEFSVNYILDHNFFIHNYATQHYCHVCFEIFPSEIKLNCHLNVHLDHQGSKVSSKNLPEHDLTRNINSHDSGKLLLCDKCPQQFTTESYLHTHMLISHKNDKELLLTRYVVTRKARSQCEIGSKNAIEAAYLKNHTVTRTEENLFKCTVCSKQFTLQDNLERHMIGHNDTYSNQPTHSRLLRHLVVRKTQFERDIYSNPHTQKVFLTRHIVTRKTQFNRNVGPKKMTDETALNNYMLSDSHVNQFKCPVCSGQFTSEDNLRRHMVDHNETQFKGDVCSTDLTQSSPTRHIVTRKIQDQCEFVPEKRAETVSSDNDTREIMYHKPFNCKVYSKKFADKSVLRQHMFCYAEDKRFKCEMCPKQFTQKRGLTKHLRSHAREKPFKCEICSKRFVYKHLLVIHLRSHTDEKLFQCHVCSKRLTTKYSVITHMRIHTGEKPFRCTICSKQFRYNSNLWQHSFCHTKEKSFKCEMCLKQFKRQGALAKHMVCHGEKQFK